MSWAAKWMRLEGTMAGTGLTQRVSDACFHLYENIKNVRLRGRGWNGTHRGQGWEIWRQRSNIWTSGINWIHFGDQIVYIVTIVYNNACYVKFAKGLEVRYSDRSHGGCVHAHTHPHPHTHSHGHAENGGDKYVNSLAFNNNFTEHLYKILVGCGGAL